MGDEAVVDVFFIGVGKCGTSWIYKYLTRRGDVGVPKIKEPYILNNPPELRADVIQDLYDSRRPRCDFSNVYYWDPSIPKKIVEHNPNAKIVLTVRQPSKRVSSHFAFLQRNGEYQNMGLVQYLEAGDPDDLVARSDYQDVLDRFSVEIPKDHILVLSLELLSDDVQEYADLIAAFIGVEARTIEEGDNEKVLGRSTARSPLVSRNAKKLAEELRKRGYLKVLSRFKESTLLRRVLFNQETASIRDYEDPNLPQHLKMLDAQFDEFLAANQIRP